MRTIKLIYIEIFSLKVWNANIIQTSSDKKEYTMTNTDSNKDVDAGSNLKFAFLARGTAETNTGTVTLETVNTGPITRQTTQTPPPMPKTEQTKSQTTHQTTTGKYSTIKENGGPTVTFATTVAFGRYIKLTVW